MASCCCEIAGSFLRENKNKKADIICTSEFKKELIKEETKKIKLLHFENNRVTLHRNKLLKDEKEFFIYHCISVAG